MVNQQGESNASDHCYSFRDDTGTYAFNDQMDLPIKYDLDWMLGLNNSDNPYGAFNIDTSGSAIFAGIANDPSGVPSLFGDFLLESTGHHNVPVADDDMSSDDEDRKEVTGQISDRIGTLLGTAKGNWRFYGATSNIHLSKDRHVLQLEPRSSSQQQARVSAQLAFLELYHPFDAHLIQHLIKLYFTWQNPSLHIVDEHAFEQGQDLHVRQGEKSTFYTDFLVNAM